jgi:FlaA1/EpsC-like NDP-sugar epimerase
MNTHSDFLIHTDEYDDILNRPLIPFEIQMVQAYMQGKHILVTGAAGSIGSHLIEDLIKISPAKLTLLDNSELGLINLQAKLQLISPAHPDVEIQYLIADITYKPYLLQKFRNDKPDIVFHIAAVKHVPFLETHIEFALRVNLFGTKVMADLAAYWKVEKFIFISTDKAVNPIGVMGASKHLAEKYVLSKSDTTTQYIITRFGNVIGSSGSVIPLFKTQIECGGPLTVTHPATERYLMTLPESCQLLLLAATFGAHKNIFIFKMGLPVRIIDIARNMIEKHRLSSGIKLDIHVIGLRKGEKLKEELFSQWEVCIPSQIPHLFLIQTANLSLSHQYHHLPTAMQTKAIQKIIQRAFPSDTFY